MRLMSVGTIIIIFIVFIQKNIKRWYEYLKWLSFKEKKDVIAELFLVIEHDELLPDSIDGYEIARKILKY